MILGVFLMILCVHFGVWARYGPTEGPRRPGSGLKSRLVSVGFILTEFGPERSHGDPFRDQNCDLGIDWFACLHWID